MRAGCTERFGRISMSSRMRHSMAGPTHRDFPIGGLATFVCALAVPVAFAVRALGFQNTLIESLTSWPNYLCASLGWFVVYTSSAASTLVAFTRFMGKNEV